MEYAIDHETAYEYPQPVSESYTIVHLRPRTNARQYCTRYELSVAPSTPIFAYIDRFGNDVQHFAVMPEHDELRIVARSHVVTLPTSGGEIPHDIDAARLRGDPWFDELADYLGSTPFVGLGPHVTRLADAVPSTGDDLAAYFLAAGTFVHDAFAYRPGVTNVSTTVGDVIDAGAGVCQDFAHVLIALARTRGIPARYCSGYVFRGSVAAVGAEASHAWAEAYLPPYGWIGYDPTNDRLVDDAFVLVAVGRDYGDVSPTRGLYRGIEAGLLHVTVAVGAAAEQQQQQQ